MLWKTKGTHVFNINAEEYKYSLKEYHVHRNPENNVVHVCYQTFQSLEPFTLLVKSWGAFLAHPQWRNAEPNVEYWWNC